MSDNWTPAELAAADRLAAAARDCTAALQNLTLAGLGAARRIDELRRCLLEQEQRDRILTNAKLAEIEAQWEQ